MKVVTTIEITLPDALAEEAKGAGPLSPEVIEDLLRSKLASNRLKRPSKRAIDSPLARRRP